jgi:hypothetical protein
MNLQSAKKLGSFRPESPGLFGPLECAGFCLPDYIRPEKRIFIWGDFDAPLFSGDVVVAFFLAPNGQVNIKGKRLEQTRDGRAWLYAWATRDPNSMFAYPLDAPFLRILAIAPLVAELEISGEAKCSEDNSGAVVLERYRQFSQPAVDEWRNLGFMPRAQLHFENSADTIQELRRQMNIWWQPHL